LDDSLPKQSVASFSASGSSSQSQARGRNKDKGGEREDSITTANGTGSNTTGGAGFYRLGIRTFAELGATLKTDYSDLVKECQACHEIVAHGINCPNEECGVSYHIRCYNAIAKSKHPKCLICRTNFDSN